MTESSLSDFEILARRVAEEKQELARGSGGPERLSADIERNTARLRALVERLQDPASTFTPEELLGIQAEMDDAALHIEVATMVLAGAAADVRSGLDREES
jgi:hypothetical protein